MLGYLGSLQQDLSLLLLFPLSLQPIQLLQELELRADVVDLLMPPVLLWCGGGDALKRRQGALNRRVAAVAAGDRHLEALVLQRGHVRHPLQQVLQPCLGGVRDVADHVGPQLAHAELPACHIRRGRYARSHGAPAAPPFSPPTHRRQRASPISRALRPSRDGDRKVSSLQERVTVPTSSELVAKMLALSSVRLTPAMEATSLMSSSSLGDRRDR